MLGIGIDSVEIERFRTTVQRTPGMVERLFTSGERAYVESQVDGVPSMAARFAAKEATMKALSVGLGAFAFHDVEVVRDDTGAPSLKLTGAARQLLQERGADRLHVSLTHTATTASAVVVAE